MSPKTFLILGLVVVATLISSTRGSAQQIIYSDSLIGTGTSLNGTSPAGDTTGDTWIADSAISKTATGATLGDGDSAYLAFTPILGDNYTFTLDVVNSTGTSYVGGGFTKLDETFNQFYGDGQESYMLLSGPSNGTTTVQYYDPGTDDTASGTYTTSEILSVNLQTTTSGDWTETYYVDGVQVGTLQDLPEVINYVGFGDLNNSTSGDGDVTSFELINNSIPVPEPSTWAMMFLGGLGVLIVVRRHKYSQV